MLGVFIFIGCVVVLLAIAVLAALLSGSDNSGTGHRGGGSFLDWLL